MLNLGFFPNFNGGDSLLLHGGRADVAELVRHLQRFSASSEPLFAIYSVSSASQRHPATLFASRSRMKIGHDFQWLCSPDELGAIEEKLAALVASGSSGHQYFDLIVKDANPDRMRDGNAD